jgi:hypothetical protein
MKNMNPVFLPSSDTQVIDWKKEIETLEGWSFGSDSQMADEYRLKWNLKSFASGLKSYMFFNGCL